MLCNCAVSAFKSLQESLDTTTSGGKLIFHLFAALAEFERDIIRERTQAGLASARARGRRGGRPRAMTETTAAMARTLRQDPSRTVREICETLRISEATFYRYSGAASTTETVTKIPEVAGTLASLDPGTT